jgi:signal peptidase I
MAKVRKRGGARAAGILLCVVLAVVSLAAAAVVWLTRSANAGTPRVVFGYTFAQMRSGDMQDAVPQGSLVLLKRVPTEQIVPGEIIAFFDSDAVVTIRKVLEAYEDYSHEGYTGYRTLAVMNAQPDNDVVLAPNVIGKAVAHTLFFGDVWDFLLYSPIFLLLFPGLLIGLIITLCMYGSAKAASAAQRAPVSAAEPETQPPPQPAETDTAKPEDWLNEINGLLEPEAAPAEAAAAEEPQAAREQAPVPKAKRPPGGFWGVLRALIVCAAAIVLLQSLLFPVLRVRRSSMAPALSDGEMVLLLAAGGVRSGNIVAFSHGNQVLLKRVVGVPGDWVDIAEDGGVIINGERLREPYIQEFSAGVISAQLPVQVPEGQYFVLSDHRQTASDSRSADIGLVRADQILGRALLRFWPLGKFAVLL